MELYHELPNTKTLILRIAGRFDAHTLAQVKTTWANDENLCYLLIDLSETTFIDSMALGALSSGLKTARQRGGDLIIIHPSDVVRVILELTRMDTVMHIEPSREAALAAIKPHVELPPSY